MYTEAEYVELWKNYLATLSTKISLFENFTSTLVTRGPRHKIIPISPGREDCAIPDLYMKVSTKHYSSDRDYEFNLLLDCPGCSYAAFNARLVTSQPPMSIRLSSFMNEIASKEFSNNRGDAFKYWEGVLFERYQPPVSLIEEIPYPRLSPEAVTRDLTKWISRTEELIALGEQENLAPEEILKKGSDRF
jgi:hypothetical protein